MAKYLAYVRVSKKPRPGEAATSIPFQTRVIEDYARSKNLQVTKIYSEKHSAAKAGKRPAFHEMIAHLNDPQITGVIFHKLDRSSRNVGDFAVLDRLMTEGKRLVIIEGEFDTSKAAGRLAFRQFCSMAVWYSENLSEEVTSKMGEARRQGYFPAPTPLGYRTGVKGKDADPRKKYPHAVLGPMMRKVFELYSTGNYSIATVTSHMRRLGMTNTAGGTLKKGSIERALRNPFYKGVIRWVSRKTGEVSVFPGNHEPLVSELLFERVQEVLKSRTAVGDTQHNHTYRKLIRCECGRFLVSSWHKGRVYLECKKRECSFTSITQERLEDQLLVQLAQHHLDDSFALYVKEVAGRLVKKRSAERLRLAAERERRLVDLEQRIARINDLLIAGALEPDEAICRKQELSEQLAGLQVGEGGKPAPKHASGSLDDLLAQLRSKLLCFRSLDDIAKREVLAELWSNRRLKQGILHVEARPAYDALQRASYAYKACSNWRQKVEVPLVEPASTGPSARKQGEGSYGGDGGTLSEPTAASLRKVVDVHLRRFFDRFEEWSVSN